MKNKKTRYIIAYTGILKTGYVQNTWKMQKSKEIPLNSINEAYQFATKFRFKWYAKFYLKMLQWISDKNYDFRTYKLITCYK